MTYIPPKQCATCREPFTPVKRARGRWSETCGSKRCAGVLSSRRQDWQASLDKAMATKRAKAARRIAALTDKRFGVLSDREHDLFTFARALGRQDGWNQASAKRKETAA